MSAASVSTRPGAPLFCYCKPLQCIASGQTHRVQIAVQFASSKLYSYFEGRLADNQIQICYVVMRPFVAADFVTAVCGFRHLAWISLEALTSPTRPRATDQRRPTSTMWGPPPQFTMLTLSREGLFGFGITYEPPTPTWMAVPCCGCEFS